MTRAWYLLVSGFSTTNPAKISAVLGGVQDVVVAKQLRRGMMDTEVYPVFEEYDTAAPALGLQSGKLCALPETLRTEAFEKKKALVAVRTPAFSRWSGIVLQALYIQRDFYADMELYLSAELVRSTKEHLSDTLLDLVRASDMPSAEAYEYFALYTEEHTHKRIMLFALAEKFAARLNRCSSTEEADAVIEEMRHAVFLGGKIT